MSTKKISLLSGIAFFVLATVLSIYSYAENPPQPTQQKTYKDYARDAELILRGTVESEKLMDGYFTDPKERTDIPTVFKHQYVTLNIQSILRGRPESNQITFLFKKNASLNDLMFSPGEDVIVMLQEYDGNDHSKYYALNYEYGKYSIVEQDYPNPGKTLVENSKLPDGWMELGDFLAEIQ